MATGDGLVSMAPTSIAYSGTSAGINADGGVDFSAVTSLSLNGVFTSDYDNYLIVVRKVSSVATGVQGRLRLSGTDATATNYTFQLLRADGSAVSGQRFTTQDHVRVFGGGTALRDGGSLQVYGPALAQPTAFRSTTVDSYLNANLDDLAGTHSLSTAYDGISFIPASGDITGNVHVFGYEE
jgi:hypothetical protein